MHHVWVVDFGNRLMATIMTDLSSKKLIWRIKHVLTSTLPTQGMSCTAGGLTVATTISESNPTMLVEGIQRTALCQYPGIEHNLWLSSCELRRGKVNNHWVDYYLDTPASILIVILNLMVRSGKPTPSPGPNA